MELSLMKLFHFLTIFSIIAVHSYLDVNIELTPELYRSMGDNFTKYMNYSTEPCDDFYKFVCGNWSSVYNATKTIEKITVMDIYENDLKETLKILLNEPHNVKDVRDSAKVKQYYTSCLNSDISYNNRGISAIVDFLRNEGGMPDLNHGWNEKDFDWQHSIQRFKSNYGFDILIGGIIDNDYRSNKTTKLYIGEISLSEIPKQYYFQIGHSDKLDRYRNKIAINLRKLGMDYNRSKRLAKEFIEIERDILKDSNEENENNYHIPVTINELLRKYPNFRWLNFVKAILHVTPTYDKIIERNSKYIKSVLNVIDNLPKRRLANYIMWKAAQHFMDNSVEHYGSRQDYCVTITKKYFPNTLNFMLHSKYSSITTMVRFQIQEMSLEIKNAIKNMITNSTWITDRLKKMLISETSYISVKLLNYDENDLELNLSSLQINNMDFFNNTLNIMRMKTEKWRNLIFSNDQILKMDSLGINAYYIPSKREIQIPIATILYPFYHYKYPKSMNYAKIGVLIANAFMTAIDAETFSNEDRFQSMWDDLAIKDYFDRKKCFGYEDELSVMTKFISDDIKYSYSNSVEIAFNAYLSWLSKQTNLEYLKLETLPAFDFTNTQLFFVAYAQNWCKSIYDIESYDGITEILPSILHSIEFPKEFNCQQGSWMNPGRKCSIWNN